jgi:excinuclease ABC subunit C
MTDAREELSPRLRELVERLPRQPGVYLLKDRKGKVIYVGKANDLHARVRSYFTRSGDTRAFVMLLGRLLGDIETVVTRNDKEALLLENTLIKEHRPRFNVKLRDDKNFLVLRLDPSQDYPRLEVTRKIANDGARYFGPYHSASSCRETLRIVNRSFQLRTCTDQTMRSRRRPCLQYQIGRCPAPCVYDVDKLRYQRQVDDVTLFLRGRQDELVSRMTEQMNQAAEALDFEQAARLRDQIRAIERTLRRQEVVGADLVDQDVFGYYRRGDAVEMVVLVLRAGKLVGRQAHSFSGQEFPDDELLSSFVNLYYDGEVSLPQQILVPLPFEDAKAKAEWLSERSGRRVQLLVPQRGKRRQLLELARRNAESNFLSRRERHADIGRALAQLERRFRLSRAPRHIECYDISGLMGEQVVASLVVMRDGELHPPSYRRFKVTGKGDDFAALYEVIARRFRRAREGHSGWELPDLMVIDGGRGQLSSALAALRDAGLPQTMAAPDVIALAKERPSPNAKGEDRPERVFLPGQQNPLILRPNSAELYLLAGIRDEAHRFAITHHKKLRSQRALRSGLDQIPGIGAKRKRELLRALGSVKQIRRASLDQLKAVPGMTTRAAESVARYFAADLAAKQEASVERDAPLPGRDELPAVNEAPAGASTSSSPVVSPNAPRCRDSDGR